MNLIQMKSNKSLIRTASALLALTIVTSGSAGQAGCPASLGLFSSGTVNGSMVNVLSTIYNFVGCGVITRDMIRLVTTFNGAFMQYTDLTTVGPSLSDLSFERANLSYTNLSNAVLRNGSFSLANLTGANLTGANLYNANFQGADLTNANLTNAKMNSNTNFQGANLYGTNFTGVTGLNPANFVNVLNLAYAIGLPK